MYSSFQLIKVRKEKRYDEFDITLACLVKGNKKVKKAPTLPCYHHCMPPSVEAISTEGGLFATEEKFKAEEVLPDLLTGVSENKVTEILTKTKMKSIVYQLLNRELTGQGRITTSKAQWRSCPWISLQNATVTCMTWDEEGVLLATATTGNRVCVWDWDTIMASDLKARRDGEKIEIDPMWNFVVPHEVNCMAWSSSDYLAIAFRGSSEVQIYDMGKVAKTVSELERVPSSAYFSCLSNHVPRHQTPLRVFFLKDDHLIVSFPDGLLILWKLSPLNRSGMMVWKLSLQEDVTSIAPLTANWLFLGGSMGQLVWLDWKKCSRKSFGSDKAPTVVATWDTYAILQKYNIKLPPQRWMGIHTIALQHHPVYYPRLVGRVKLRWVTSGGFALSMELLSKHRIQVLHSPQEALTKSSAGEVIQNGVAKYSIPIEPVPSHSTNCGCCCCWQDPPQVTQILPYTDNRVLSQYHAIHSKAIALLWLDKLNHVHQIHLKKRPRLVLIHPSCQWIVLANDMKISILNARQQDIIAHKDSTIDDLVDLNIPVENFNVPQVLSE